MTFALEFQGNGLSSKGNVTICFPAFVEHPLLFRKIPNLHVEAAVILSRIDSAAVIIFNGFVLFQHFTPHSPPTVAGKRGNWMSCSYST